MCKTIADIEAIDDADARARAVEILRAGGLVAIPTETVYGLAADATNPEAVAAIYAAKGRPAHNPLISHVASPEMAACYVTVSPAAQTLMDRFWPGPLTLVLPRRMDAPIAAAVAAGLDTLAVRCPALEPTRQLIETLDRPLAAPSANPSGKLSPTTAGDVQAGLGDRIPLILDGGPARVGIESTIVGVEDGALRLLRPGSVIADDLTEATGLAVLDRDDSRITAPGQLVSHYAPNAHVRLNATTKGDGEILIGFGTVKGDFSLSHKGDLDEAASRLFTYLRQADEAGVGTIAVAPIPEAGIGIAINDRLRRAAAPRDSEA
ncbi:L-threonylcarbamoyladenylate synthase [Pseudokordiimonas caeni]|uniref:L-threonylcarbamoyladenylate synthase n=1 Tax=Pseudokordiimonas caeni TaxID=2997908 RepID=UPI002810DCAF|nr:L-threonylcarbamoyladenylate synthase [Pseudokordiimonas caeni]